MAYTFISGATGGIGRAFAIACAKKGYNLFLTGRTQGKLSALKAELRSINPSLEMDSCVCDLSSERSRARLLTYVDGKELKFDRLINVAGVDTQKAFCDYTQEKMFMQLRVNAEATLDLTHALLKRRIGKMEIITVSSMSGVSPMPYFALYSATKALLTNFFTALHYELKKEGVKVTTVLPGAVPTRPDVIEAIKKQGVWGKISKKTPEFVAEKSLKAVKKNKLKFIPGFFNKILYGVIKLALKRIVLSFIAKRWKKQTKDAF